MSKLSDSLSKLGMAEPARIGFGQPRGRKTVPLVLIAGRTARKRRAAGLADALDALVVEGDCKAAVNRASGWKGCWGASLKDAGPEELDALKEAGCDFVLVESCDAAAAILRDDGMSRGLVLPDELTDRTARAIEDMPFEFLVMRRTAEPGPLTVSGMIALQKTVSLFTKHIFLEVEHLPDKSDVDALKDLPISALLLNVDRTGAAVLKELHAAIGELKPRERKEERRPLLPLPTSGGMTLSNTEYDDDDWGDD